MRPLKACLRLVTGMDLETQRSTRLLLALPVALFLVTVAAVAAPDGRSERFAGGNWQRGETLYHQNCASCHRADLKGRGMAPSLLGVTQHMEDEEIVAHARRIGETMCCARHLRNIGDREFADIVAYFHAVDRDPRVRSEAAEAGSGGSCCSMMGSMGGMDRMSGMEGMNGRRTSAAVMPLTRKVGGLALRFDSIPQPPRTGANSFEVRVQDEDGRPVTDARMTLALSMPSMSMGGPTATAKHVGDGVYTATADLSMAGEWRTRLSVTRPGRRAVTASFDFLADDTADAPSSSRGGESRRRPRGGGMGCCSAMGR